MNVLVFTHSLALGGAQLYLAELVERLSKQGLRFTVVAPADGELRERLEQAGAEIHLHPMTRAWTRSEYEARVDALSSFASPRAFELVLVNTIIAFDGLEVAARLGLPSILAAHESLDAAVFWARYLPPGDLAVLERLKVALASASVIVFEASATRELYRLYAEPERLVTLPYGIDLGAIERFRSRVTRDAARSGLGVGTGTKLVLCLGTIEERKSQASLARAFSRVADRHPGAVLALVGLLDAPWSVAYAQGIAEHLRRSRMRDSVRIEPLTPDPFPWLLAADVLVCASDNESLPRVILEAMAFGTLVVSTDVFGIPEVVEDGVTGFLCRSRDEEALAERLSGVLDTLGEHWEIREAAIERVRQFHDADAYAVKFRTLIGAAIEEGQAARFKMT